MRDNNKPKFYALLILALCAEVYSASTRHIIKKRNYSDQSVRGYLAERTCWWNEVCKEEFHSKFRCRCPRWSYCRAPGRYYDAHCSMTRTGYIWTQPETSLTLERCGYTYCWPPITDAARTGIFLPITCNQHTLNINFADAHPSLTRSPMTDAFLASNLVWGTYDRWNLKKSMAVSYQRLIHPVRKVYCRSPVTDMTFDALSGTIELFLGYIALHDKTSVAIRHARSFHHWFFSTSVRINPSLLPVPSRCDWLPGFTFRR